MTFSKFAPAGLLLSSLANGASTEPAPSSPQEQTPLSNPARGARGQLFADGPIQHVRRGDLAGLTDAERRPDPAIRLCGNDGAWHDALDPLDDVSGRSIPSRQIPLQRRSAPCR
jgi:hypothetical protein